MPKPLRIGIDTGGTFTDLVVLEGGKVRVHKLASTPNDPARAVLSGIAAVRGDCEVDVVHGSTVGLNAILTGNLARTALVTNAGFRDLVEIGRQARLDLYDLEPRKPVVPVPRALRFTVATRREADGRLTSRASARELARLASKLGAARVEAVAIALLHGYAHPRDERAIARALARLGIPVTCGSVLAPILGEFERICGAVLNAAITPVVAGYLARLEAGVRPGRVRLLRSSGGILDLASARREPARALFSGPAGGVVASRALAKQVAAAHVAAFDMGGTSTDVSLVGPDTEPADTGEIAGLPVPLPTFAVHTVGCGGGSIAWCDAGGALRVGPQSAGADPGPACYGTGDEATITDAHMALGHLGPESLLGGAFAVDPDRSVRAVEKLGRRLGLTPRRTAEGILEVADATMLRALLVITAERAIDPSTVPLVAYGGAGGMHAASLARRLAMPYAIVPEHPGAFSALGLALASETHEVVEPVLRRVDAHLIAQIARRVSELAREAKEHLAAAGIRASRTRAFALLRYAGQGHGVPVPFSRGLVREFVRRHEALFGFAATAPLELVEIRVSASPHDRKLPRRTGLRQSPLVRPKITRRSCVDRRSWAVFSRSELGSQERIAGPAIVEDYSGTTIVPPGTALRATSVGLVLTSGSGEDSLAVPT